MPVRMTIDLPEALYDRLRHRSESSGASIRSLIVQAIEQTYPGVRKGRPVTGALLRNSGKRSPLYPTDENPHDLVFPDLNVWLALSDPGHPHSAAAWNWLNILPESERDPIRSWLVRSS